MGPPLNCIRCGAVSGTTYCVACSKDLDFMKAETMATKTHPNARDMNCYEKAMSRGQKTFTLVEQDMSSPFVIIEWIKCNIMTCPAQKLRDALESAIAMRDFPKRKLSD